jgi:CRP/FNR family transcriptional regulator, cyclic AMP receptor protein
VHRGMNAAVAMPNPETLRAVPLFSDLNQKELVEVAQTMRERRFAAGDTVTREGAGGAGFFVIADGHADVSVDGESRGTLGPGDFFGEVALITGAERTATIVATTDLTCYGLTPWDFRPLVEGNPSIAWKLLESMAKKLH